jgi:hypothetical protein
MPRCDIFTPSHSFPDDEGPDVMKKIAGEALMQFHNQYPPMVGSLVLIIWMDPYTIPASRHLEYVGVLALFTS